MTTDFDSFDGSPHDARLESPHGVFNTGPTAPWDGHIVAMVFIDEACSALAFPEFGYADRNCEEDLVRTAVFDRHIDDWETLQDGRYAEASRQLRGGVMHVGVWTRTFWTYRNVTPPSRITDTFGAPDPVFLVQRLLREPQATPELSVMQGFLNRLAAPMVAREEPFALLILMDESRSLTRAALEGPEMVFTNFLAWARARPDVAAVGFLDSVGWEDERWVGEVTRQLRERIGE